MLSNIPGVRDKLGSDRTHESCDICFRAKQTREVFYKSDNKVADCLSLIHCDLGGVYRIPASCGAYYFLTIVDDHFRAVWVYLLFEKKEVAQTINNLCAMVERQFKKRVGIVLWH